MKKDYEKLVEDFCRLCGVDEVQQVTTGEAVDVDDVNFSLSYDEKAAADRVSVYCDYGPVPEGREAEVYRALLETNLFIYASDSAVFSLSPETGRVVCATRFALKPLSAEELRGVMTFLSQKAKEWRQHYFDTSTPAPKKAMSGNATFSQKLVAEFKSGLDGEQVLGVRNGRRPIQ